MRFNLPDNLLHEICAYAEQYGIRKVILFGSRARGTHQERSDIDLAVSGGDSLNFYYDLEEKAHTLLMFDVVNLDKDISAELKNEIERDGIVIYEKV
ncbi:MAG: nucleotidyltransferase domain-containing protein [bacterium]|nr:nucleotidyltransferase domain-containing protein [bacterium]